MQDAPDFNRSFPKDVKNQIRINNQNPIALFFQMRVFWNKPDFWIPFQKADLGTDFIEMGNSPVAAVGGNMGTDFKKILPGGREKPYFVFPRGQGFFSHRQ